MTDFIPPRLMALNFTLRVYEQLYDPSVKFDAQHIRYIIKGGVLRDKTETPNPIPCIFYVDPNWMTTMPLVCCKEPWCTKGDMDWHMGDSGFMCLDHGDRWQEYIAVLARDKSFDVLIAAAVEWVMNSTSSLLGKHRLKYQGVFEKWQPEWDFWPHGRASERLDKTFVPAEPTTTESLSGPK